MSSPAYNQSSSIPSSRNHSPSPSYTSTQTTYTSTPANRLNLRVAVQDHPFPVHRDVNYSVSGYPSPPSPQPPPRPTPSPLRALHRITDDSPSISHDLDRNRWNRGGFNGYQSPNEYQPSNGYRSPNEYQQSNSYSLPNGYQQSNGYQSPVIYHSTEMSSPIIIPTRLSPILPSVVSPSNTAESIASSSEAESSGKSQRSVDIEKPAFVFPGSRSVAKPKVSKKNNSPVIKANGKSRTSKDSSSTKSSNPGTDIASPVSPTNSLHMPTSPAHNSGFRLLPTPLSTPKEETSDVSSVFSADSGDSRLRPSSARKKATISSDGPGTPSTYVFPTSRSRAHPKKLREKKASSTNDDGTRERKKFMGILLGKKKKVDNSASSDPTIQNSVSSNGYLSQSDSTFANSTLATESEVTHEEPRERAKIKSRVGNYPLDPYDSVLLDNDRHTGELLSRLNPTNSPTFHNYGNAPPSSVLDLGCGQGHWVVDAAIAWKGYGTKVTGYDIVDISAGLFPWAAEQGVIDNIRFVRGNFLKQILPFSDESFELVRMSCLALCVTSESWIFVLQEVARVLMIGGRLELIDDHIFFPYGKNSTLPKVNHRESIAPQLDITIPSSSFTTFNLRDGEITNPGLGLPIEEVEASDFYDLYGVEEEPDESGDDDAATINKLQIQPSIPDISPDPRTITRSRGGALGYNGISSHSWKRAYDTSKDLEALFEHMLKHKFGISMDPTEFILGLMQEAFGHAREMKTMHLTLAPSDVADEEEDFRGRHYTGYHGKLGPNGYERPHRSPSSSRSPRSVVPFQYSGLILWPSTFIPMSQSEVEIHASKHLRMLISCKNYLIEHAVEATDDEDIDEESVLEALWEYEGFLRHRFNIPPPASTTTSEYEPSSDAASMRNSIAESVTMDSLEAMWEIQSEFRQHFGWQRSSSRDRANSPATTVSNGLNEVIPDFPMPSSSSMPSPSSLRPTRRPPSTVTSEELTHVRTFRVYEATKIDESLFGGPNAM